MPLVIPAVPHVFQGFARNARVVILAIVAQLLRFERNDLSLNSTLHQLVKLTEGDFLEFAMEKIEEDLEQLTLVHRGIDRDAVHIRQDVDEGLRSHD
jgi:hypothetical protein